MKFEKRLGKDAQTQINNAVFLLEFIPEANRQILFNKLRRLE